MYNNIFQVDKFYVDYSTKIDVIRLFTFLLNDSVIRDRIKNYLGDESYRFMMDTLEEKIHMLIETSGEEGVIVPVE